MTATNHALTGALIGLVIASPVAALIVALLSHFVLDALPHFTNPSWKFNGRRFKTLLLTDMIGCFLVAGLVFASRPEHWSVIILCAFVATSPDFAWVPDFVAAQRKRPKPKYGPFRRFASWIQWSATPRGGIVEAVWAIVFISLIYAKLT